MPIVESTLSYLRDNAGVLTSRVAVALLVAFAAWVAARLARRTVTNLLSRRSASRAATLTPIVSTLVSVAVLGTGLAVLAASWPACHVGEGPLRARNRR